MLQYELNERRRNQKCLFRKWHNFLLYSLALNKGNHLILKHTLIIMREKIWCGALCNTTILFCDFVIGGSSTMWVVVVLCAIIMIILSNSNTRMMRIGDKRSLVVVEGNKCKWLDKLWMGEWPVLGGVGNADDTWWAGLADTAAGSYRDMLPIAVIPWEYQSDKYWGLKSCEGIWLW